MSDVFIIIDSLAKDLKALQPIKPELQEKLHKKFRLEFNYNSNHLEGNTLTYGETELLLIFDDAVGKHNLREFEEMKNHDVAFKLIEEWAQDKDRPLNEQQIKNLNQTILVRPYWKEAITGEGVATKRLIKVGDYKEFPNNVLLPNGEIFQFATVVDTPILMKDLLDWYHEEEKHLHPVTLAAMLHYKFVRIHPFDDGNGRVARLLMNYVMLQNGLPPIIIKSTDKKEYLRCLHLADLDNNEPFISYIAKSLQWSLEISIKAARGEDIEEKNDWEKKLNILKDTHAGGVKEVTARKSPETLEKFFHSSVVPLLMHWDDKLREFEPLFISRQNTIGYNHAMYSSAKSLKELTDNAEVFNKKFFDSLSAVGTSLEVSSYFKGIRNKDSGISFNAGAVTFKLFENSYEVNILSQTGNNNNRLYSQTMSAEEISEYVNILGRFVMKNLEEYLEK